jgi:predicted nucleic acid-binding protein
VLFIDTAYALAVTNARDRWYAAAIRWQQHLSPRRQRYITTDYVLVEIADGLAAVHFRQQAHQLLTTLRTSPQVEVVPASPELLTAALDLYQRRPDKDWGLTDCASFVVMADRRLTDALTTDDHFRQAGFRPLLLDDPPAA